MPMVNGKKYPYTKEGMAAAKKAAKQKPSKTVRKPGMMNRNPRMRKAR